MSSARWLVSLLVLALLLDASVAAAQGRLAVDAVRGPRGGRARSLLVESLEEAGWTVVSERELDEVRDRLGLSRPSDEDWVSIARELDVVAILDGRVSRARRSWRLTVRVRSGADGAVLGDEGWGGRTASAIEGVRRSGAERLAALLARAHAPTPLRAVPRTDESPWYAGGAGENAPPEEEEEPEEAASPSTSERHDALRIAATGGTLFRSFAATAEVYRARRDPGVTTGETLEEQRAYQSSGIGHFELGLEGEFYPGALGDQPFPYLGLLASFRNSVGLGASACRYGLAACERVSIATNQTDVQVGARARYRFGPSRRDFEGMIEVLYGYSSFTFDTGALQEIDRNAIIPPLEYQYVSLGGGFRYGLVPDYLSVALRADYRAGISVGAGARSVWGRDTGAPSGFLVGLDLIHEATWLAEGVFVALCAEYFQMITAFRGQVGCADMGAGCEVASPPWLDEGLWELWPINGSDVDDVAGGVRDPVSDHYVRWALHVGYAFR